MNQNNDDLHRMRRFAMTADYMRTNGFTTPLFSFGIAAILWQWFPAWQVFAWAALSATSQIAMGIVAHKALKDGENPLRLAIWRKVLMGCALVAGTCFGGAVLGFYLPGERLNNLLMVAVAVGSFATLAAMTSPDRAMMAAATAPFVVVLCAVMGLYEEYPYNLILTAMAVLYCVETFLTANKLSGMVGRMIDLQIGNDRLISSLADEKAESDRARIRAENASRAKSNFLANMSHELRTPLNAILGFSEIIRDRVFGDQATPRYAGYAADIHKSGAHLLNLINDILDLSRIEAGKWELSEEAFEIDDVFETAIRLNKKLAEEKKLTVLTECPAGGRLFADRSAVAQILVNLVSNAVKFTPEGGKVSLRAHESESAFILEVSDTGVGIQPDEIARVLERFGQARHDVAATTQGVGLGLPIVKGLVEAHGGSFALESALDQGTRALVSFPRQRSLGTQLKAA